MRTPATPHADVPRVAMQVSRGAVVATLQVDLDDAVLARFREDLLGRIQESGSRGVVLDVSGLATLDSEEFAELRRILLMASLMGARSVLVGLRPGIASALVELGAEVEGLQAATDLDAAFDLLEPEPLPQPDAAEEPPAEPDAELREAEGDASGGPSAEGGR